MDYFEIIISFFAGFFLIALLGYIFSLKTKGLFRLTLNTLVGAVILILLNVLKIVHLPINPFNALIIGFLGIPGVAVVFILNTFF